MHGLSSKTRKKQALGAHTLQNCSVSQTAVLVSIVLLIAQRKPASKLSKTPLRDHVNV